MTLISACGERFLCAKEPKVDKMKKTVSAGLNNWFIWKPSVRSNSKVDKSFLIKIVVIFFIRVNFMAQWEVNGTFESNLQ